MSTHSSKQTTMARPRSEDKQLALLEAATDIIAAQGLGAPTSLIAKQAGVAEGTLFRYFPTKNDLLNALYVYQCKRAAELCHPSLDVDAPLKERMRAMWDGWIDWGIANPAAFSATLQLEVSDKLTPAAREEGWQVCSHAHEVFDKVRFAGLPGTLSSEFFDTISTAIAQATIEFASAHPEQADACKAAAFEIIWPSINRP